MISVEELKYNVEKRQRELRIAIDALIAQTNAPFISLAPQLSEAQLANCRVLPSRYHILDFMPKGAVCAEVGTQQGNFASEIVKRCQPKELHVIDIDLSVFNRTLVQEELDGGIVQLYEGDSSSILANFPDEKFDWIYIDADHTYNGFLKDLEISSQKVKSHGFLCCNDYTVWSPGEVFNYGVLLGVHEFCVRNNWEFVYLGLQGQGYHDVCIRKRP